jgi:hypothetical protein
MIDGKNKQEKQEKYKLDAIIKTKMIFDDFENGIMMGKSKRIVQKITTKDDIKIEKTEKLEEEIYN